MISVKRLGHITLTSPDIARQVEYYVRALGLHAVDRERRRVILATKFGQEAIVLEAGPRAACERVAFQVAPTADLQELAANLSDHGVKSELRSDVTPGVNRALAFKDPKDTLVEVYANYSFRPEDESDLGVMTRKLGHVAFNTPNVKQVVKFYCEVLGFRVSDWRADVFAFLRCNPGHHAVNFVEAENVSLHHFAFEVRDEAEINRSCDLLAKKDIRLVWGPIRHHIGHSISTYHKNPDNLTVELFTDLDVMYSEELGYFEPRRWHQDRPQRPKVWPESTVANYWGPASQWQGPKEMRPLDQKH